MTKAPRTARARPASGRRPLPARRPRLTWCPGRGGAPGRPRCQARRRSPGTCQWHPACLCPACAIRHTYTCGAGILFSGCRPGDQCLQVCPGAGLVAQAGGSEASAPSLQALAPGGGVGGLALHDGHGRAKLRARRAALSLAVSTGRRRACWQPAHRLGRQPVRRGTSRSHTGRRAPGGSPPRRSYHTAAACRPAGTLCCRPPRSALSHRRQPLPPRPRAATAQAHRASRPCQRAANDTSALSARRLRSSRSPGGP
jgi:hypothetical protein